MGEHGPGETPEQVAAEQPEIITPDQIPAGPAEGEVVSTGPEYESPEQPVSAPDATSVEEARANVDAAEPKPEPAIQPRNTDVTGYKVDEYTGGRVSGDEKQKAADEYAAKQGYPTSADKAATLADQSKPGWLKFLDRFRRH